MKRKKRRKRSLLTPEEQAAAEACGRALEERIDRLERELNASGSAYVSIPRAERLAFALRRIETKLATSDEAG